MGVLAFLFGKTHYFYGMKRMSSRCLTLVSVSILLLFSCNKTRYTPAAATALFQLDVHTQAEDQIRIPNEIDALFNDINTVLLYKGDTVNSVPDTITSSFPNLCGIYQVIKNYVDTPYLVTMQYDGTTCDGLRARLGTIFIYVNPGTSFSNANDTIGVNFDNFKTYWLADDDSVTLNGTFYLVDSTGGNLATFNAASQPIVQQIIGVNINVLFENQTTGNWQIGRRRTYTYNSGLVITTTGIDTASGFQSVTEYGGNRYGNGFITSVTTPLVVSQGCSWRITAGQEQLVNPAGTTILTFAVDSLGNRVTGCPANGTNYYYKASWTGTGEAPDTAQFHYYSNY
jgi:hypothetical protein